MSVRVCVEESRHVYGRLLVGQTVPPRCHSSVYFHVLVIKWNGGPKS
jgi:hypothetical protein